MGDIVKGPEALINLGGTLQQMMTLMSLCSLRLFAAFLVLPATSDQVIQGPVRNGFVLMAGIFLAWGQPGDLLLHMTPLTLVAIGLKESLIGLMIGLAASTVFWIAEGAGVMIDNQAGFNSVQQTNPLSGQQSTPVSNLLSQMAIMAFYTLGGMTTLIGAVFESFKVVQLTRMTPNLPTALEAFAGLQATGLVSSILLVSSPVVLVLLLIDLGLGLMSKTAEKLEPNSLGQPIKGAVALLMLAFVVSVFFQEARPRLALHGFSLDLKRLTSPVAESAPAIARPASAGSAGRQPERIQGVEAPRVRP